MNAVNWFEIPAVDLARAKVFYEAVFGVPLMHMDMGPSLMEMFPSEPGGANAGGALVDNGTLDKVAANGGVVLVPKMSIGQHGFIAHFLDSEGNRVALHSMQ